MPFKNMQNVEMLGDEIYLYKNFLLKDEIDYLNNFLNGLSKDEWHVPPPNPIPHVGPKIDFLKVVVDRLSTMVDGYFVHHNEVLNKLIVGDEWGAHADNAEFKHIREKSKLLKDGDKFEYVDNTAYGVIVYINDDYEGGEIYYPNQNIQYKPCAGDLLIHSSEEKCRHGVRKVINGDRYAWTSRLSNKIKVPVEQ